MVPPTLLDNVQTSLIPGKLSWCIQIPTRVFAVQKLRHRLLWELWGAQGLCGVGVQMHGLLSSSIPCSSSGDFSWKTHLPSGKFAFLPVWRVWWSTEKKECDKRDKKMKSCRRVWGWLVKDPRDSYRELLLLGEWGPESQMGETSGICLPQGLQTTVPLLPQSQWAWMVVLQTLRDHRYHFRLLYPL